MLASCLKDPLQPGEVSSSIERLQIAIGADQEGDIVDTRTELVDGKKVWWLPGDEIAVFSAGEKSRFTSANKASSPSATFTGTVSVDREPGEGDDAFVWALYPYDADATYSSGVIKTSLPSSQTAAEGTFADDLLTMVGRSLNPFVAIKNPVDFGVSAGGVETAFYSLDGNISEEGEDPDPSSGTGASTADVSLDMDFKNVCSGMRITLDRSDIRSITLTATGGEAIAGTFKIGLDSKETPEVRSVTAPASSITLTAPGGGKFKAGVSYYFVTLPVRFSQGVTFTFSTGTLVGTRTIKSAFSLTRGKYGWKDHLDANVVFSPDPNATSAGDFVYATHKVIYDEEFRAVWIATVKNIGFPLTSGVTQQKAEFVELIQDMKRLGFNAVVFQVNPMADAFWQSSLLPWSRYLTGTEGKDPGYDPLQFAIETAHAAGMELHAWFNPYRIGDTSLQRASSHPINSHSTWYQTYKNSNYWNPGLPAVRTFLGNVMKEVVMNYDVDGTHIDDYFYPSGLQSSTGTWNDTAQYNAYGNGMTLYNWRVDNVDKTVRLYQEVTHAAKQHVVFGAAPGGTESYAHSLYCYPTHWLSQGTVDYISPQIYWDHKRTDSANFDKVLSMWLGYSRNENCPLMPGLAPYMVYDAGTSYYFHGHPEEMLYQIEDLRSHGLIGCIWFRERYCQKPLLTNYIPDNIYTEEVLTPQITLHPASLPAPVVSVNGTKLSWSAVQGADNYVVLELTRQSSTSKKWDAAIVSSGTGRTFNGTSGHYYIVLARSGSKRSTYSAVIYLP